MIFKSLARTISGLCVSGLGGIFSPALFAQVTLLSENFGNSGATSDIAITSFAGYQNTSCVGFSGSGTISDGNPTAGNNCFLEADSPNRTLILSGIKTSNYSSLSLSFDIWYSGGLSAANLDVEVSTDGIAYSALTRPSTLLWGGAWRNELCTGTIPATANLRIRFTNTNTGTILTPGDFRIDNILLSGSAISASTDPLAYSGWPAAFSFNAWSSSSGAGTFPTNMVFRYGSSNITDPALSQVSATHNYALSYDNTCGTRINGLGSGGVLFCNASPGNVSSSTGNLGELVLALNTSCRGNIQVSWTAGTSVNHSMPYALKAQYRIGSTGSFTDLPNSALSQIEYSSPNGTASFGPITLPASCANQSLVQVRWVYYALGTYAATGPRDEIFLDEISVTSSEYPLLDFVPNFSVCSGKSTPAITFSSDPASTINWTNSNTSIGLAASGSGNIASFATPLSTSSGNQLANLNYSGTLNGCTSSTYLLVITVKGAQSSSVWQGAISSDWFQPDNWTNCVCGAASDVTISAGPNNPDLTAAASCNNITIASAATLSIAASADLSVNGTWTGNGSLFAVTSASVSFTGTSTQSIAGTASQSFSNLRLNNSSGLVLSTATGIQNTLLLSAGTLSTNGLLTILSSTAGTGRIGPISSTADITGNVTVQRLAPGGNTGWAQMGAPLTNGLTMADWNDDFVITCSTCPDGYFGFTSIYGYNESASGLMDDAVKYSAINSISDPITHTKGYWVYLGNGSSTSTDITFDVTGSVAKSSCLSCGSAISIPVSRTSNVDATNDGWNLVSNPLPSAISWSLLRNGNSNVDNAYYVYNADLGYASYVNGVSSGGLGDEIPMCQGFYVHASTNTNLTAGENVKVNADPVFFRPGNPGKEIFRLKLSSASGFSDQSTYYLDQGATMDFQKELDAYKLNFDASSPYVAGLHSGLITSIKALPALSGTLSVKVKAVTPATGSFTFTGITEGFPSNICIQLKDELTGKLTDLRNAGYVCTLSDTSSAPRFTLTFFRADLQASVSVVQNSCTDQQRAFIAVKPLGGGPWDYDWICGNRLLRQLSASAEADSMKFLPTGIYRVVVRNSGSCEEFSTSVEINALHYPAADFQILGNEPLQANDTMVFRNLSGNVPVNKWDFGDGNSLEAPDAVHHYKNAGTYVVRLWVQTSEGCADSTFRVLTISARPSAGTLNSEIQLKKESATGAYFLAADFAQSTQLDISLYSPGAQLLWQHKQEVRRDNIFIPLQAREGIYLLKVKQNGQKDRSFKLIR